MGSKPSIIGDTTDEVGLSPVDFYSWGHVDMGIASFLLFSLFNTIPSLYVGELVYVIPYWSMILLVIAFALLWELVENTLFIKMGIKFEGRKDSKENMIWDIIFVIIGGMIMWIFKGIIVNVYLGIEGISTFYIIGVISFLVVLSFYFIGYFITGANTKTRDGESGTKKCESCGKELINIGKGNYQCSKCKKI